MSKTKEAVTRWWLTKGLAYALINSVKIILERL